MPDSFQKGFQAGSAVLAPYTTATQQGQALQLAQQQEVARRLFQQKLLEQELAARADLTDANNLFRERLVEDQLAASAQEAEAGRLFQAQRDLTRADNEYAARQEENDRTDRLLDERRKKTTDLASSLFGRVNQVSSDIQSALQLTQQDQEAALAAALQLTGVDIKRTSGEDVVSYLNKVSQKNPEVLAEYSAQLQAIQQSKATSPDVLNLQTQGQIFGNIFQNVMRSGNVDPSFMESAAPNVPGNVDPNDLSAIMDTLGDAAPTPPANNPGNVVAPASGGVFSGVANALSPIVESGAPSLPDLSDVLFGSPSVTKEEIPLLKDFAVQSGIAEKDFQDLVNNAPTDSNAQKSLRDLKQRKLQSEAASKRATQVNPFGFDSKIPIESGPRFR